MPLVEHLFELRNRLAVSLIAITITGILVGTVFYDPVFSFIREPYCRTVADGKDCNLYVVDVFGQFQTRLRIASIGGIVLSSPVWLYQLGAFITPALHRKEKRYAAGFFASSLVLFSLGIAFAYLTIDKGLSFLLSVGGDGIVEITSLPSYLSFLTLTLLAFGISFLFPVVLVFLNVLGILSAAKLRGMWRGMLVGVAFFAAVLTPSTDPYTFFAMAVPLWLLYGVCIVIAAIRDRGARRRRAKDPVASLDDDEASYVDPTPSPL